MTSSALAALLSLGLFVSAASSAFAQEPAPSPPPTGVPALGVGYVSLGLGVVNLATLPVCRAGFYPDQAEKVCVSTSLALGIGEILIGLPLVIMGHVRRARFKRWELSRAATMLERVRFAPLLDRPGFAYRAFF